MKINLPYIFTSPRVFIRQEISFDNTYGLVYQETGGEHAIWAARVPFLPAMLSEDFTRLGKTRIPHIQQRMFRFIYDLARTRENRAVFELRFISTPNPVPDQPNLIDIIFLGKVFSVRQRAGQPLAERLWEKFVSIFPLEDPFNYPLEPITDPLEFQRYYEPLSFEQILPGQILEIRKHEDMPIRSTAPMGRVERKGDYIAHPFVPNVEFNPMGRFLAALAAQPQKCYTGISLRPTRMFDQEVYNVSFAIGQFKKTATEDDDITEEYIRSRSGIGIYVYQELMEEREQLVMVRVHLVGEHEAPYGLAEALGSEMMGNANNKYPTQWVAAQPADEHEFASEMNNLRFLEHEIWGHTLASPPMERLRYLATAREAYGAFRLPVPPESGYMPGILVKDEPFIALADELELQRQARANLNDAEKETMQQAQEKKITLGMVYHRGNRTPQPFRVNLRDLTRHALIAGSTGSGKSTTIKYILAQLWQEYQAPFLVLYPIDKPDYRELLRFPKLAEDLLIFTLGDERTSPFRFNPFEVPEGVLLKTHLSRLMRVFNAAFTLQDPLPMVYREALRQVYRQKGLDIVMGRGETGVEYPIMSEFHVVIKKIADSLEYGKEVKDNVRQASVIRIADLLENAGYVVNTRQSMSFIEVLNRPTVMELGRVGSTQDTSLLMGFLLMRFAEEVERHPRPMDKPHITVVEEAHRLMAETAPVFGGGDARGSAGEDFSNILAEVRGYGEGILIAEQIPTMLVKGAIGNTFLKMMHWLEDAPSFELFSNIMNLNLPQREYARTLTPGFAIVRSPFGRPVHIKVPEFADQPGYDDESALDLSDAYVKERMTSQRQKTGIVDVQITEWDASLSVSGIEAKGWRVPADSMSWLLMAPFQTCMYCKPLHRTSECQYGARIRNRLQSEAGFRQESWFALEEAVSMIDVPSRWLKLNEINQRLLEHLPVQDSDVSKDMCYCYFAHEVDRLLHEPRTKDDVVKRKNARNLLVQFDAQYKGK